MTFPEKMPYDILKGKKISIGFDPKLFTKNVLKIFFKKNGIKLIPLEKNLIDNIWKRKVKTSQKKFYILPKKSIGEHFQSKINKIVNNLKKNRVDYQFVTASENVAWLLNIRGGDAKYSPIPNSYILVERNKNLTFFCNLKKVNHSFKKYFKKINFVNIKTTGKVLSEINKKRFIVDRKTCSYYFE